MCLVHLQSLKTIFLHIKILDSQFFSFKTSQNFQYNIHCRLAYNYFWWEVSCRSYWWSHCVLSCFSFDFESFSLSLVSSVLIRKCLGVDLFTCILQGAHWTSWMCRLMFLSNLGNFSHYLNIFVLVISLLFPGTLIMPMLVKFLMGSQFFLSLFIFLHYLFTLVSEIA